MNASNRRDNNQMLVSIAHAMGATDLMAFGDPSGERARLELDDAAVDRLLAAEVEARLAAAADYERHSEAEEAARLRHEAAAIGRYRTA